MPLALLPAVVVGASGVQLILSLCIAGIFALWREPHLQVLALPLDPPASRELGIGLLSRRQLRPMARKFLSQAQDIIAQMK